jgi:DUF971 family protein
MTVPISLRKTSDRQLEIVWDDNVRQLVTFRLLRSECPCATCREKAEGKAEEAKTQLGMLPVLSPAEARPLDIVSMRPVGNYAYSIEFSDGHNSGIFTFEYLRELAAVAD